MRQRNKAGRGAVASTITQQPAFKKQDVAGHLIIIYSEGAESYWIVHAPISSVYVPISSAVVTDSCSAPPVLVCGSPHRLLHLTAEASDPPVFAHAEACTSLKSRPWRHPSRAAAACAACCATCLHEAFAQSCLSQSDCYPSARSSTSGGSQAPQAARYAGPAEGGQLAEGELARWGQERWL